MSQSVRRTCTVAEQLVKGLKAHVVCGRQGPCCNDHRQPPSRRLALRGSHFPGGGRGRGGGTSHRGGAGGGSCLGAVGNELLRHEGGAGWVEALCANHLSGSKRVQDTDQPWGLLQSFRFPPSAPWVAKQKAQHHQSDAKQPSALASGSTAELSRDELCIDKLPGCITRYIALP